MVYPLRFLCLFMVTLHLSVKACRIPWLRCNLFHVGFRLCLLRFAQSLIMTLSRPSSLSCLIPKVLSSLVFFLHLSRRRRTPQAS